jgi:putative copper resistance protein D
MLALTLTVVGARLAQFAGAMILLGSPLFFLYGLPGQGPGAAKSLRWPRPVLFGAAVILVLAAFVALCAQTAVMSGSMADAFSTDALSSVLTDTQFGSGTSVRLGLAVLAGLILVMGQPSRALWVAASVLGAGVVASFALTGHGSADEGLAGWIHLVADILHLAAAAVWLGALVALAILIFRSGGSAPQADLGILHRALEGFSGIGSGVVAVLLASGLINGWYLVGPSHLPDMIRTPYGLLLTAKVVLFGGMLALAAANRFAHTPRLGGALAEGLPMDGAIAALRRSVLLETSLGLAVLILVSILGTLAPLSSQ